MVLPLLPPLLPLAISALPELARLLAGEKAGRLAGRAGEIVQNVTGLSDPAEAARRLQEDRKLADTLRIRLAEIALEASRLQQEEQAEQRRAELEELGKRLADTQGARNSLLQLARDNNLLSWGAPLVSLVVALGFFGCLIFIGRLDTDLQGAAKEQFNIIVGALVAAFTAVVNFWIGSSRSSQVKDVTAQITSNETGAQIRNALEVQAQQTRLVLESQTEQSRAALEGVRKVAAGGTAAQQHAAQAVPAPPQRGRLERCLPLVLSKEGGFVNHPRDPGGMTNQGVTRAVFADFRDIAPEEVTEEMMRAMTPEEVREIYRSGYWTPARCDEMPAGLDLMVFDFAVNAGVRRAVRVLQELLHVKVDGSVGPMTLAAANAADPLDMIGRYAEARLAFYRRLDTFDTFGRGWTARVAAVRDEALRMATGPAATFAA